MCFLGAGYTHKGVEKYQRVVQRGIDYLVKNQKKDGDLRSVGSNMYAHGLASIALCEAYGMTQDALLESPAQRALDFIAAAQAKGGGWRYAPRQAGDTSVAGWMIMAIASGRMAGLDSTRLTTSKAVSFLDAVFTKSSGTYGYTAPVKSNYGACTSIGTLCRMYLHFGFDRELVKLSVKQTSTVDPKGADLYAKYYAMQVLHHWGGETWEKWNAQCRDHLVGRQRKTGVNGGSWAPTSRWARSAGGRHYETCLSIMCLEVYYRHLPLYQREAFQ